MANAQDPRGWLDACPELTQFTSDPTIAAAISAGDGTKLFAALEARRKGPRATFEHRALDVILRRRRLFSSPMSGAPALFTFNGIGTRIYGKSDLAADDTFIGTLFFTVLYVPVWPIAQYLCWSSGRQYQFFGKVPLSRTMKLWRAVVGAGAAAVAIAIALTVWSGARDAEAYLVNGLDVPVVVSGAGQRVQVAPDGRVPVKLQVGRHRLEASVRGRVVESVDVDVPRWTDVVVYNVLGSAPLYAEGSWYFPTGENPTKAPDPPFEFYGGRSFVVRDGVPYRFAAAPQTIQMDSGAKRELRWSVDLMKGGWQVTANVLRDEGKLSDAATLAERIASAQPGDRQVLNRWLELAHVAGGPVAALAPAKAIAQAAPDDVDAQRVWLHFLLAAGRRDEAERIFAERAEKEPGNRAAAYLRARVAEPARSLELLQALAKDHPEDPMFRRALAWRYYAERRWSDALREYGALAQLAPDAARAMTRQAAVALAGLGEMSAALARVDEEAEAELDLSVAVLHAQIARLAHGARPPGFYLARVAEHHEADAEKAAWRAYAKVWGHVLAGEPAPDPKDIDAIEFPIQREACRIMMAAAADPSAALKQAAAANRAALWELDDVVALILAGEAARVGREGLAVTLAEASRLEAPGHAVVAFVRGEDPVELRKLEPEERAALLVARVRAAQASRKDPSGIMDEVRANDVLHGAVAQALARWPKPVPSR